MNLIEQLKQDRARGILVCNLSWDALIVEAERLETALSDMQARMGGMMLGATAMPSLEEFSASITVPKGYEDCFVIERNGQVIWLRKEDCLPTDLICFYDGDYRDVLTPYDSRVQPPIKLAQQHAQAALSDDEPSEMDAVIACLGDDAARLQESEPEVADNMRAAERLLEAFAASQQPAAVPSAPTKVETVTLDGHQLRHALDLLNPDGPENRDQLDDDLTFGIVLHKADDGTISTGMCCWNEDMGDEVMPLDGEWVAPATQVPDLTAVIHWLECGFNVKQAAKELRAYQKKMGQEEAPVLDTDPAKTEGCAGFQGKPVADCGPCAGAGCDAAPATHQQEVAAWDEREAFEEEERKSSSNLTRQKDGQYENPYTQSAWEGWIARAAFAAPAAPPPVLEGWRDDLNLIRACVEGYPSAPARNQAMAIIRKLLAAAPSPAQHSARHALLKFPLRLARPPS